MNPDNVNQKPEEQPTDVRQPPPGSWDDPDGLPSTSDEEKAWESHVESKCHAGSWADVARMMAAGDDSGFDWDAWKDEMKEGNL